MIFTEISKAIAGTTLQRGLSHVKRSDELLMMLACAAIMLLVKLTRAQFSWDTSTAANTRRGMRHYV